MKPSEKRRYNNPHMNGKHVKGNRKRDETDVKRFRQRDAELQAAGITTKAIAGALGYASVSSMYGLRSGEVMPTARRIHLMDRFYQSVMPGIRSAYERAGVEMPKPELPEGEVIFADTDTDYATDRTTTDGTTFTPVTGEVNSAGRPSYDTVESVREKMATAKWLMREFEKVMGEIAEETAR